MLRQITIGLLASAVAISPLPLKAQDGSAEDLGVMSINLKDVVKPRVGFQGALQGAGTPNQTGIGGFLPLKVNDNSVWFVDALANINFADRDNYSSIINTTVAGSTISTSSRLGYRWLNGDRSWMYGINAGYDTRPMATGYADTGVQLFGTEKTVFFQQAAINAEAVSDKWNFNTYALIPTGEEDHQVNWFYTAGALSTYGVDIGYMFTPSLSVSLGGYYQNGDLDDDGNPEVDNVGILGRLAYDISRDITIGANLSYDESFDTRLSADIKWRFNAIGGPGKETLKTNNAISALSSTPRNRDVRIHDGTIGTDICRWVLYITTYGIGAATGWADNSACIGESSDERDEKMKKRLCAERWHYPCNRWEKGKDFIEYREGIGYIIENSKTKIRIIDDEFRNAARWLDDKGFDIFRGSRDLMKSIKALAR